MAAPLSILQVGAGLWGRDWAGLLARTRGIRLAGVVDAAPAARTWVAETLAVPAFRTLGVALVRVDCDAVLVIAPPAVHGPLVEEALAAGRHAIVEKPLALDLGEARSIADAADAAGRHVVVSQNYRFRRQPRTLRRLVADGGLGRLVGLRISCRRDLRDTHLRRDWRGRMRHPYLLDMAIHHVDLIRMISGREVEEVDARSWPAPGGPFRGDPSVAALLTLAGGAIASYEGTWAAPFGWTSWNGDWELVGTRAQASWTGGLADALEGSVRVERDGVATRAVLARLPAVDRLGVLRDLERAIATGQPPECSARDNLRSLATVLALARSAEERRAVRVSEIGGT